MLAQIEVNLALIGQLTKGQLDRILPSEMGCISDIDMYTDGDMFARYDISDTDIEDMTTDDIINFIYNQVSITLDRHNGTLDLFSRINSIKVIITRNGNIDSHTFTL